MRVDFWLGEQGRRGRLTWGNGFKLVKRIWSTRAFTITSSNWHEIIRD
jgi:hypothetical protein